MLTQVDAAQPSREFKVAVRVQPDNTYKGGWVRSSSSHSSTCVDRARPDSTMFWALVWVRHCMVCDTPAALSSFSSPFTCGSVPHTKPDAVQTAFICSVLAGRALSCLGWVCRRCTLSRTRHISNQLRIQQLFGVHHRTAYRILCAVRRRQWQRHRDCCGNGTVTVL